MSQKEIREMLFYARKMLPVPSGEEQNQSLAMTALSKIHNEYGFILDQKGTELLQTASKEDITNWYYDTATFLKKELGADREYKTFYPGFPDEVMEKTSLELFIDQISHYWFGYMPDTEDPKKGIKSLEEHPATVLSSVDQNNEAAIADVTRTLFCNLLASKQTPSSEDMDKVINPYLRINQDWDKDVQKVTNRELLAYLYMRAIKSHKDTAEFPAMVTNDVLRLAKDISYTKVNHDDEISLLEEVKDNASLISFSRSFRRELCSLLNEMNNLEEDVARNKKEFKGLFKLLHVGEYPQFEKLFDVADRLRNNEPLRTHNSKLECAFASQDYQSVIRLASQRPGEMVQKFNRILHMDIAAENQQDFHDRLSQAVQLSFKKCQPEAIINLIDYLDSRTREDRLNVHSIKSRFYLDDKVQTPIDTDIAQHYISILKDVLAGQILGDQRSFGAVYMDDVLNAIPLPKKDATQTKSLFNYPKGSDLPIEKDENGDSKKIRLSVWFDLNQADIDLGAIFFQYEKGCVYKVDTLYYGNEYYTNGHYALFSGDNATSFSGQSIFGKTEEKGCAECIDLDLQKLKEAGIDYVMATVVTFHLYDNTVRNVSDLNVLFGWQEREELNKSEIYSPAAVKQKSEFNGPFWGNIPCIIDVNKGSVIWVNQPVPAPLCSNTKSQSFSEAADILIDKYIKQKAFSIGDMMHLIVEKGGGYFVDSPEEADTVCILGNYENATEEQKVISVMAKDVIFDELLTAHISENSQSESREIKKAQNICQDLGIELPEESFEIPIAEAKQPDITIINSVEAPML